MRLAPAPGDRHGPVAASQAQRHRALLPRGVERARPRVPLLQLRHRPRTADRGNGALAEDRPRVPEDDPLPARERRDAHGRGLRHGDRARAGRPRPRRRRHRELGGRDAQRLSRADAGAADGGPRSVHAARRADRLARHLRALRAGALRSGGDRAAVREVGVFAPLGRDRERGAAPRAHDDAERSEGAGVPDAPARDARRDLGRERSAVVPAGAVRRGRGGRRGSAGDRSARRPADRGAGTRSS